MRLGFVMVCDAARIRPDGLFDAVGASQQLIVVDPSEPRLARTVLVQLLFDEGDVHLDSAVSVALRRTVPNLELGGHEARRASLRPAMLWNSGRKCWPH